jgi:ABC-type proline/glycine betaine transport system ATPase subunit
VLLADKIAVMKAGCVLGYDTPRNLISRQSNRDADSNSQCIIE